MGLEQMAAITGGKKFKRPYVDEINARAAYLPSLYQQRAQNEYADKNYALNQNRLAQDEKFGLANLQMQQDAQKEMKKRNKTARNLGYANIGLGVGLGALENYDTLKQGYNTLFPVAESVSAFGPDSPAAGFDLGSGPVSSGGGGPIDWAAGVYGDYLAPAVNKVGGGLWDFGKGIFDSIAGDAIDVDWTGGFGLDDVIDFGW